MTILLFKTPENRPSQPPMFNIPPLTLYAILIILAVQIVFALAPQSFAEYWGYNLAFVPARYTHASQFDIFAVLSPVTHLFVHGGWFHVAMNVLMLMAFGAAAERMMGGKKAAVFFFLSGFAGAAFQFALNPTTPIPMVGCSGALSGLFAAIIMRLQESGQMPAGRFGIWGVGALWIGLSILGAFIGGDIGIGNVAWGAHAGGFLAGVLLSKARYFRT